VNTMLVSLVSQFYPWLGIFIPSIHSLDVRIVVTLYPDVESRMPIYNAQVVFSVQRIFSRAFTASQASFSSHELFSQFSNKTFNFPSIYN